MSLLSLAVKFQLWSGQFRKKERRIELSLKEENMTRKSV